jgi:hypothetical protein
MIRSAWLEERGIVCPAPLTMKFFSSTARYHLLKGLKHTTVPLAQAYIRLYSIGKQSFFC